MGSSRIDVNERNNKELEDLVVPWRLKPLKRYCIKNTNLVDVLNGTIQIEAYIFIENGIISKIEFGHSTAVNSDVYEVIDGTGKFVTPGLFDNHVHMASVTGELDLQKLATMPKTTALLRVRYTMEASLARGFTTVRDCGGAEGYIKAAVSDGSVIGPRLIICGHAISQTGGHGDLRPGNLPASAFDSCSCHYGQVGVIEIGRAHV